jgi:cell division protein FtsB
VAKIQKSKKGKAANFGIIGLNLGIYLLVVYFIYHSLNGERGIFAYQRLSKDLENKKVALAKLNSEKNTLENKAKLMSNGNIDIDMLDELARNKLGLAGKNEIVVLLEDIEEDK